MRLSPSAKTDETRRPAWLTAIPYAHRGLHGPGRIENSRAAFEAAIAAGLGIELDVQLSRDGEAVVFHDYELDRLIGMAGRVRKMNLTELQAMSLKGAQENIPSLIEALHLIAGRTPVLIEMKAPGGRVGPLCRSVLCAVAPYAGNAAVMSFNPEVPRWFSRHAPQVTRGLVVTEKGKKGLRGRIERRLSLWRARPDFLAYDIRDLPSRFASAERKRGLPVLTWTVPNRPDQEIAAIHADQIIHELPSIG